VRPFVDLPSIAQTFFLAVQWLAASCNGFSQGFLEFVHHRREDDYPFCAHANLTGWIGNESAESIHYDQILAK
jgi:hypothetical protein